MPLDRIDYRFDGDGDSISMIIATESFTFEPGYTAESVIQCFQEAFDGKSEEDTDHYFSYDPRTETMSIDDHDLTIRFRFSPHDFSIMCREYDEYVNSLSMAGRKRGRESEN